MPKMILDTPENPFDAIKATLPERDIATLAEQYRQLGILELILNGIDERDFLPLLDQVRAIRSAMVTEVTFRAPEDDTENSARLYITLDHCLTEGKLEELVA